MEFEKVEGPLLSVRVFGIVVETNTFYENTSHSHTVRSKNVFKVLGTPLTYRPIPARGHVRLCLLVTTRDVVARAVTPVAREQKASWFTEIHSKKRPRFLTTKALRAHCNKSIPHTTAFNEIAHRLTKAAKAHSRAICECLAKGDSTKIEKYVTVKENFVQMILTNGTSVTSPLV